jgi:uncharacterized protein (TIGR03435 family)
MMARVAHTHRMALLVVGAWMWVCAGAGVAQGNPASGADTDAVGPTFEVAVIRPTGTVGRGWSGTRLDPSGRFEGSNVSLNSLVWLAYLDASGKRNVITDHDAPKWVDSEQFDINAKVDDAYMGGWDKLSEGQRMDLVRPMIRRLLADRFHLKMRVEMRKTPVYVLVQAKGGAHVKEVPAPPHVEGDQGEAMARWMEAHPGKGVPGSISCGPDGCTGSAMKISYAIGTIAANSQADRMVIDETGLKGYYDFSFRFVVPNVNEESPMQAVEDDLGMRFEPKTIPVRTYMIESAEKPSVDGA